MKKIALFLLASLCFCMLAGCSQNPTPSSGSSSEPTSSTGEINPEDYNLNLPITVDGDALTKNSLTIGEGDIGLPVQEIAKKMGFTVSMEGDTKLTVDTGRIIEFDLTAGKVLVEGTDETAIMPPILFEGEVYYSAPELSELLGFEYEIADEKVTIQQKPLN